MCISVDIQAQTADSAQLASSLLLGCLATNCLSVCPLKFSKISKQLAKLESIVKFHCLISVLKLIKCEHAVSTCKVVNTDTV